MALVAYVLNQDFGSNKAGDVVQLDADNAEALVDAGILSEATQDDVSPDDEPEEQEVAPEQDNALSKAVNRISRNIENSIVKATAKVAVNRNRGNAPNLSVPAEPKQDVYRCLGEMLKDSYFATKGQYGAANRLHAYSVRRKTSPLGANEGTASAGGYGIKPTWADQIWDKARDYPRLLDMTERIPISGDTYEIPTLNETSLATGSRHGGVTSYWLAEGNPATYSNPALGNVTAVIQTNVVMVPCTLQLLQDANIEPFDRFIAKMAGLELVYNENQAVTAGTGTTMPVGILNQPALISVTKSSNDTAAMFGYDDLANCYRSLYSQSRKNAVWIVTPEAYNVLAQMTFVNLAGTVTQYPAFGGISYNAADEIPMRIFGKPVIEWVGLPALGLPGDIMLVDPTQLTTVEKPELFADYSNDYAFNTLQVMFRFYRRYDIRSPWTAPLSSPDGKYSYSPFIALTSRGS